jgi:hypothetical protein
VSDLMNFIYLKRYKLIKYSEAVLAGKSDPE